MSKHMQLTVTIKPFYKKSIEGTYSMLGGCLRHLDEDLANQNPSLYELAGQVDKLLYRSDGTKLREVLLPYKDKLKKTYNAIQENIADWNLAQADKHLYSLEDIFDEIESNLA
ncbi:MAG: hypothetical protein GY705_11940 [Bacteroidetes bacterium]|nr:hypothetical protein [Bacteroidota bacterium]